MRERRITYRVSLSDMMMLCYRPGRLLNVSQSQTLDVKDSAREKKDLTDSQQKCSDVVLRHSLNIQNGGAPKKT
jgi:hypothetical protein